MSNEHEPTGERRPPDDGEDLDLDVDVERAGQSPPDGDDIEATVASLLDAAEPAEEVYLIRLALAAGTDRAVAERLLAALEERLTTVGSTLPAEYDAANPRVDVLVETDHDHGALAGSLEDIDPIEGVVVASVTAADPAAEAADAVPGAEGLSIYRLDDHLVVTDNLAALLERFRAEMSDPEAPAVARETREAVDRLDRRLSTVDDRVGAVEGRLDAVDERVDGLDGELEAVVDGTESAVADLRASLDDLSAEVEAVGADVEDAADASEVASLRYHLEEEVPTRLELEYIFAPAAERLDGEGTHPDMESVVEEVDAELRRTHALREAGFLDRLRWLLTGRLPVGGGEESEDAGDDG